MRAGTTLIEIGMTIALLGLMAGMTFPRFQGYRDRIAVDAATTSVMSLLATARHAALRRATVTAVRLDTLSGVILIVAGADTLERRPLGAVHGVRLATSRDSIAFGASGLGHGAANSRIVITRGAAGDTISVSRLGRARR